MSGQARQFQRRLLIGRRKPLHIGQAGHPVPRRTMLGWLGGGLIALTGAGWLSTRWIRSPQQALAETSAPPTAVITAPVERRVLRDTIVLRGTVGADNRIEATPVPVGAGKAVVTRIGVRAGEEIAGPGVLVEVSGRPLLALPGEVPAYRDLRPGGHGIDIAQLQAALAGVGHDPGERDGVFGAGTKRALTAYYDQLGYEVATTGDSAALDAAQERVRQADRAVVEAQDAVDRARHAPMPAASPPAGGDPVAEAEKALRFAEEDRAVARRARDSLERSVGPMLPLAEFLYLPSFPARVEKLDTRVGAEVVAPLITLSSGALLVRARANPAQRALLKPGLAVDVVSEMLGLTGQGTVATVGELEPDDNGSRSHPLTVVPAGDPFDPRLAGSDVRVTVAAASSDGEVLVVPVAAVFADADGNTAVLRLDAGRQVRVPVAAGMSGNGYVSVTPVSGTRLEPGDAVVVGRTAGTPVDAVGSTG
jgi:HlyD family secretion protein